MCCRRYFRARRPNQAILSMCFFYDSVFLFTIQCSSPSEHFPFYENILFVRVFESILFLWEHSLRTQSMRVFSLCTWRCCAAVSCAWWEQLERSDLMRFSLKLWAKNGTSPETTTTTSLLQSIVYTNQDTILLSKQYNLDMKPHCIIWRQGIHAFL